MERGLLMLNPLLRLLLMLPLRLTPGTDTMAMASTGLMATDTMDTDLMAMDTTMERGLLMLNPLLRLLLMLPLRLTPGTDTMAMASTDLMATDTTMERGLLMLSLRLLLLLMLRLMLMPGMDTTDTPTGLMPMDTTDTTGPMAIMAMAGERSKKHNFYQTAAN